MKKKKICFIISEKKMLDFKLRLRHDGITQSSFIDTLISIYLENDEYFVPTLRELKGRSSKIGKKRRTKTLKEYATGRNKLKEYRLSNKEREKIFDLLEEVGEV